jgi:hypothetical protein
MKWHKANGQYLTNRRPVATVGLVWSQRNTDFFGRENAGEVVDAPYEGFAQALIRARIPYIPVHADHIDREAPALAVLVLANVGALSDAQCASIRRFVERGGSLIATEDSTLYNEWGDARPDFALGDLLRVHLAGPPVRPQSAPVGRRGAGAPAHTYLRLHPEFRARVDGPETGKEPAPTGERHPVLRGFDETDIIPFGGALHSLRTDAGAIVPLTFIPEFPVYPPETAWMRETDSKIPGLVVSDHARGGRIAYLAADLDRRYLRDLLPDHGDLLANVVRWAAGDNIPLSVQGAGLLDCHLYRQQSRLILHVVNLTSSGTWRAPMDELIRVGPLKVKVKLPVGIPGRTAKFLVSTGTSAITTSQGWAEFEIQSVLDHEVVVIA